MLSADMKKENESGRQTFWMADIKIQFYIPIILTRMRSVWARTIL